MTSTQGKSDGRYILLRVGLVQRRQLRRLVAHMKESKPLVVDTFNYDVEADAWCPLAVGLNVPALAESLGIKFRSDLEAKSFIVSVGKEVNPNFGLNPLSGVSGKFFTLNRMRDLTITCHDILRDQSHFPNERN